jgi:hypothetical protein
MGLNTASGPQVLTISNPNSSALPVSALQVAPSGSDFAQTHDCGTSLAAKTSCQVTVVFTPKASGPRSAEFSATVGTTTLTASLSGSGAAPVYAALNPADISNPYSTVLSNGNLTLGYNADTSRVAWRTIRSTVGKSSGKWYWEVRPAGGSYLISGVTNGAAIATSDPSAHVYIGGISSSVGFYNYFDSAPYAAGAMTPAGHKLSCLYYLQEAFPNGTSSGGHMENSVTYMMALDADSGKLYAGRRNLWVQSNGTCGSFETAAPIAQWAPGTAIYPAISSYPLGGGTQQTTSITVNFGASSFLYEAPVGFNKGVW